MERLWKALYVTVPEGSTNMGQLEFIDHAIRQKIDELRRQFPGYSIDIDGTWDRCEDKND
jgi:hypothetical protein